MNKTPAIFLFQPNNHSKWRISYRSVDESANRDIVSIIEEKYSQSGDKVKSVEQVDEIEVNSNNFKVVLESSGGSRIILLRRIRNERDPAKIVEFYRVTGYLEGKGVKVPDVIKTNHRGSDYFYVAFEFLPADHYRGTGIELASAAGEFGKMDSALASLPEPERLKKLIQFPKKITQLREFSKEIWKEIFEAVKKHKSTGPEPEFDERLLSFRVFILEAIASTPPGKYVHLPEQVIHFDLHPHNLLTDGTQLLAILDFDSLRFMERIRGVAFALHRMVRQYIIYEKLPITKEAVAGAKELFFKAYLKHGRLTNEEMSAAAYFIRHEALSRISYAMKDYYFNDNGQWRGDLEKQTAAIAEAAYFE